VRYFLEAKVDVKDKNDAMKTKNLIQSFLQEVLQRPEIVEAPGMFAMAFEKK